ncbi:MAG: chromosomal replication initiator protein DnaA [bacterium]
MDKEQLWQATLGEMELLISKANFTTWFKNTYITSSEDETIVVAVPNAFTKNWLEKKYHSFILKALQNISDNQIKKIIYCVETSKTRSIRKPEIKTKEKSTPLFEKEASLANSFGLNPNYTLSNFIIGKSNELAVATAKAVAEKPGHSYNPLFIYGGVGLGKTHLMQAVGNEILKSGPVKKIIYITCEQFVNEFIKAISNNNVEVFKDKYRKVDVLLVDDIQFLAGKDRTQEEFFHTFNALHQENKQIILSSDRPPKSIATLKDRLISRFEWGMIADIAPPDLETRMAILEQKAREKNFQIDKEISRYIATNIQTNIRELEGALNKIIAFSQMNNQRPAMEDAQKILSSLRQFQKKGAITAKRLLQIVAEFYDIKLDHLTGSCRKKNLTGPRQIAMYLMRKENSFSFPTIGQEIGGRDHTTAMHACLKIEREIEINDSLKQDIELIKQRLYNL